MRYPSVKIFIYSLLFIAGIVTVAAGLRDLTVSSEPWPGDFAIEPATDGAERSPMPATATFAGRPYSGIASLGTLLGFAAGSFRITLDETQLQDAASPTGTLKISLDGEDTEVELSPGTVFAVGDNTAAALALRPYVGLWPDPMGTPMLSVSIRLRDLWIEHVFLQSKQWLHFEDGLTIRFLWCDNEEEARRHIAAGRPGIESARWGVHDEGRTHWFSSFAPGAGVELADGRIVTLLALDEAPGNADAAIEVEISELTATTRRRIPANTDDPLVVFEYPSFNADLLLLYAWEDAKALADYLPQDADSVYAQLTPGEEWIPEAGGIAVRLEQVSRAAVPVESGQSTIFEALLQIASSRVRVRQGEAVRVGDALLRFSPKKPPPSAHYRMTLTSPSDNQTHFILTPDNPFSFSSAYGKFSLTHDDLRPGEGLTLRPQGLIISLRLQIGVLILVLAMTGILLARRATH